MPVYTVIATDSYGRRTIASIRAASSPEEAVADYLNEASPVAGRTYRAEPAGGRIPPSRARTND